MRRAQAAGKLRQDIAVTDMPMIQLMLSALMDASRDVEPDLWRRYLALLLRGMSAGPDAQAELPVRAVLPDDVDLVMSRAPTSGR